ncbi:MAG: DUF4352 domain-containing protein [Candidatus Sulfotelmatobacter sp.]
MLAVDATSPALPNRPDEVTSRTSTPPAADTFNTPAVNPSAQETEESRSESPSAPSHNARPADSATRVRPTGPSSAVTSRSNIDSDNSSGVNKLDDATPSEENSKENIRYSESFANVPSTDLNSSPTIESKPVAASTISTNEAKPSPAAPRDSPSKQHEAASSAVTPTTHRIGEEFSVGYWSYRCNGATWRPMIVSLGTTEAPDAEFLVVGLYIRNNDRTASTLPRLKLVDAQGREYDESSKGAFMPGVFDTLKQLNPGVSSGGYAVFDVPHGQYSLQVSGGFESGEHALIDLSRPPQSDTVAGKPSPTPTQSANAETPMQRYESTKDARAASVTNPSPQLRFEAGVRLWIRVNAMTLQPDGSFIFRGTLLQPITLAGPVSLDQSTELVGSGTVNGGHVTVSVTGFTVRGENYGLRQAASGVIRKPGSGPAVELNLGKVLEMWLVSASVYEKTRPTGD